nr:class I SAM-dependent methyltransferase [Ruegeria sp. HKCCD4884]
MSQKTKDCYARTAQDYEKVGLCGTDWLAYRDLPELIRVFSKGETAIDFGCGSGKSTRLLKEVGLTVTGLDISASQLTLAISADPSGDYRLIDEGSQKLPLTDVAIVVSVFVFMEFGNKEAMVDAAQAIRNSLAKDGVFIMVVTTREFYSGDWLTLNTKFPENDQVISGGRVKAEFTDLEFSLTDYFWTHEDYVRVLEHAGFNHIVRHLPLGETGDGLPWKDETSTAPFAVYIAFK